MISLKIVAAAFVAAFAVTGVHAGTVTQTGSVPDSTTDFTKELAVTGGLNATTFAGFNAALGTLTSVDVTFSVDGFETGTLTNQAASTQTFLFSSNNNLTLSDHAGSSSPASLLSFLSGGLTLSEAQQRYTLASGASTSILPAPNGFGTGVASENAVFTGADAAEFIGKNFSLDLTTLSGVSFSGGGGNILASLMTREGGHFMIDYNYAPVSVPESSSLAMLVAGLLGLTLIRARRPV